MTTLTSYEIVYNITFPNQERIAAGWKTVSRTEELKLMADSRWLPARTNDEAVQAVAEFLSRPFIGTVEIVAVNRLVTSTTTEDVTALLNHLPQPERTP